MSFQPRIFNIIVAILLIIISIVHLGIGGTIIRKFQDLEGLYARETGLAGYNVFIGVVGLLLGGFGLVGILTSRKPLSRVIAYTSIGLVICVLASWIAALVIHSSAINDLNSRFSEAISQYASDPSSRRVVDRFQITYQCCGTETPLEWDSISLPTTRTSTQQTKTTTTSNTTVYNNSTAANNITTTRPQISEDTTIKLNTTALPNFTTGTANSTTSMPLTTRNLTEIISTSTSSSIDTNATLSTNIINSSTTTTVLSTTTVSSTTSTLPTPKSTSVVIVDSTSNSKDNPSIYETTTTTISTEILISNRQKSFVYNELVNSNGENSKTDETASYRRRKRQNVYPNNDHSRLSDSITVVLPQSCCISQIGDIDVSPNEICTWMVNSTETNSRQSGCSPKLGSLAVSQTLALAVINTFMLILSLAMISILLQVHSSEYSFASEFVHESFPHSGREDFALGGFGQTERSSGGGYNNLSFGYPN